MTVAYVKNDGVLGTNGVAQETTVTAIIQEVSTSCFTGGKIVEVRLIF